MAIQITRKEYEEKFGVKPVVPVEDFDTSPAPIRVTRAEYDAMFRPQKQTFGQDFKQDIKETGIAQQQAIQTGIDRSAEIDNRVASGETSKTKGLFQKFGSGLGTASNVLFQTALGGAKAVLPQKAETRIAETIGKDLEKILAPETRQSFIDKMKESDGGRLVGPELDNKAGVFLEEVGNAYKNNGNFRADVQATGGILEWLALPGTIKGAVNKTADVAGEVVDLATPPLKQKLTELKDSVKFTASPEAKVKNQANDILRVETKYKTIRDQNTSKPQDAEASRTRIAQSNVLEGAVDETGRINTQDAIKVYRSQTIDGYEDIIRKNLEQEGNKINLKELELDMRTALMDSGLEGGALYTALKGIEKQLKGLAVRADTFGDVPLYKLQDAKIGEYKSLDYKKVNQSIYKKTLARVYKEAIEKKSKLEIKEINQELAKFYGDLDRLKDLDGKIVDGGKLGRYGSQIVGTGVGMAGGSIAGGVGAAVGGIIGGEIAQSLKGKSMASTFNRGINGNIPESQILKDAKTGIKMDLKTPNRQVGIPIGIKATPEMKKVEAQIARNVYLQKKAIKAGDFTLVAMLKDIYENLIDKLTNLIEDYKKNGIPLGLSIRKTVTPESVAKKADKMDIKFLAKVIDKVEEARTSPEANQILDNMGLGKADNEELVQFAKDVISAYEGVARQVVSKKDLISTNLANEAKKYKSAEEFVKAQPKFYHGGEKIDSVSTRKSRFQNTFYFTESSDYAKSYGGKNSVVNEIYLDPSANLIDLRNPSEELVTAIADKLNGKETGKIIKINRPDGSVLETPEIKGGASNPVYTNKQILQGIVDGKAMFIELPEVKKILKEMGYDGLVTTESNMGSNYGVWNGNKVKTRTEMEDLWNNS
jgi:hypothetical protein